MARRFGSLLIPSNSSHLDHALGATLERGQDHLKSRKQVMKTILHEISTKPLTRLAISIAVLLAILPRIPLAAEFAHPGLLHTQRDFDRIRVAIANQQEPIYSGFKLLVASPRASSNYNLRGPFPEWGRAPNIRTGETVSDAEAAYHNALMWAITGKQAHADKSIQIINAWMRSLKKVSGIDGVLASGLQGFKFANAAEILRHSDSGWSDSDAKRCEQWLMEVWHPTIEHYAYFANANWESAALQTKIAIAVYCNDRKLFEETVRYAVNGAGNGSIPHTIVYPSGQCQETTRAQHYAQLGLGLLVNAAEVAWNQGVDLYGWDNNRILQGFEYTAKYGLGEDVPYQHYLDRTGKYGFGGRNNQYDQISTISRGNFYPIFERPLNHYVKRRGLSVPYTTRVVASKRPEGFNHDHVGLGTLTDWQSPAPTTQPERPPAVPAGLVARTTAQGIRLSWVGSVEPISGTDATSYLIKRSNTPGPPYETQTQTTNQHFVDTTVEPGKLYHYIVSAINNAGQSDGSYPLATTAGLPLRWSNSDVGKVSVSGFAEHNGETFSLEGQGADIAGRHDSFHFVHTRMRGDGSITARIILPMSSQWTKPGVIMRESLDAGSAHASVLLLPHWKGAVVSRSNTEGETSTTDPIPIGKAHVIKKNRLMTPYWVRLVRTGNRFTGYMGSDEKNWQRLGSVEISLSKDVYVGLPACSQLKNVTTTVTYDNVNVPE